ncbi:MAG: hypothetical protein K6D97_01640 [Clostridia bacterium]|nr:hypothetical protein [Clostridia bacterium]
MADRIVRGQIERENPKKKNDKKPPKKQLTEKQLKTRAKAEIALKVILILGIFFVMTLRDSEKDQLFTQIKMLKAEITQLNKDNDQLEISIQNSLNLNTIEQAAKDLLGMQKLTAKQTRYINLPKKDYVEPRVEEVVVEGKKNIFEKIIGIFKK